MNTGIDYSFMGKVSEQETIEAFYKGFNFNFFKL